MNSGPLGESQWTYQNDIMPLADGAVGLSD